jgi:hypothetical protein
MNIVLAALIGFTARKNNLKAQAPVRDGCYRYSQRMKVFALILLMPVRKFFTNPALKIRDIAC